MTKSTKILLSLAAIFLSIGIVYKVMAQSFEVAPHPEPDISSESVSPFTVYQNNEITIRATATDVSGVATVQARIKNPAGEQIALLTLYDDGAHGDGGANNDVFGNHWNVGSNAYGAYTVDIIANDYLGNYGTSINATSFTINEHQEPAITINEPNDGEDFPINTDVTISTTSYDNQTGIDYVEVKVRGTVVGTCNNSNPQPGVDFNCSAVWNTGTLETWQPISARAYDTEGYSGVDNIVVTVGGGLGGTCQMLFQSPTDGEAIPLTGGTYSVEAFLSSQCDDVPLWYYYTATGGSGGDQNGVARRGYGGWDWDIGGYSDGEIVEIEARGCVNFACDPPGYYTPSGGVTVTMGSASPATDTTPPIVSIVEPSADYPDPAGEIVDPLYIVTANAYDLESDIDRVEFFLDSESLPRHTELGYEDDDDYFEWAFNAVSVPNGAHELKAVAYHGGPNGLSAEAVRQINNNQPVIVPTVTITSPFNEQTVKGTIPVSITASDDGTITEINLYHEDGGGPIGTDTNNPATINWDTTKYFDGKNCIYAQAFDNDGNDGLSPLVCVNVSNGGVSNINLINTVNKNANAAKNINGVKAINANSNAVLEIL